MKSKAFSSVAILGTLAVVFIGCVVQNRPADSNPTATAAPTATPAPATTDTAAPTATTTATAAPTTTTTAAPAGKVMKQPKAADPAATDGGT
ncbi:MAG: hypothetical protein IPM35_20940 [Myxococcales bacterium]|nr:hypothetical protein [Myxococcales bacterium]